MLGDHIGRYSSRDGWVFSAAEGGAVHHHNFSRRHFVPAVRRLARDGVIPDGLRFHDTRHTCAAFLIDAGRSLHEVKEHLGHSSIRVTSDRYGHLYPEARAALADALDAVYRDAPAASPRPAHAIAHLSRRATAAP